MSKVELIARWQHPLAAVRRAEITAKRNEARFQLAVLAAIDLDGESPEARERIAV